MTMRAPSTNLDARTRVSIAEALVANRCGSIAPPDRDIAALLAEQLVRPVQWARTLATLAASGVDHYVVAWPGKLTLALVQKYLGARTRVSIVETLADVHALRTECR